MKKSQSQSDSWGPERRLQAIIETSSMSERDLGEYLRKNGIHSSDLEEWKKNFIEAQKGAGRPRKDPEVYESRKREKALERELNRKDKALAEMSARVILLKKSHKIFGDREDEE